MCSSDLQTHSTNGDRDSASACPSTLQLGGGREGGEGGREEPEEGGREEPEEGEGGEGLPSPPPGKLPHVPGSYCYQ